MANKKQVKPKKPSKKWEKYEIKDRKIIRKKHCPKCGAGIFLAENKDRLYCGKCHYTIFERK